MNLKFLLLFTSLIAGCATQQPYSKAELKGNALEMPASDNTQYTQSIVEIEEKVRELNQTIGGYKPRFNSESHRQQLYIEWSLLLKETISHREISGNSELIMYLFSEIYRQGSNLSVRGATARARKSISKCLKMFPNSVRCHFSSAYFYLSPETENLNNAEESLLFLRDHFSPRADYVVERHYITLYISKRDLRAAKRQINRFVKLFPSSPENNKLIDILDQL